MNIINPKFYAIQKFQELSFKERYNISVEELRKCLNEKLCKTKNLNFAVQELILFNNENVK